MPDVNDDPQLVYTVYENNNRFEVCTASGRIVLVFADEGSQVGCIPCTKNNIGEWVNMMFGLIGWEW